MCEGEGNRERERRKEGRNGIINVLERVSRTNVCTSERENEREREREMEFFNENSNQQLFCQF